MRNRVGVRVRVGGRVKVRGRVRVTVDPSPPHGSEGVARVGIEWARMAWVPLEEPSRRSECGVRSSVEGRARPGG